MSDILSLFSVLYPHLSTTTVGQFSRVVLGLLAMTGRVQKAGVTAQYNAFSTPLSLEGLFTGCFLGLICWILKAPISSLATKPWSQNQVNPLTVYRVFSRLCMAKRSRD